jgi:UDP-N-acetylglucosamine--N-acetylmuramyl-(pentapeptide) pyrophosphoryl-undecaprenol N-acetylglucosamine transferase
MKIILTGGGTGGHIYPALALADNIRLYHPNVEFLYVGTTKGLEADIVPKAGMPMSYIDVSGFKRSISLDNIKVIYRFIAACIQSRRLIKEFKPDIVIGTGGYVAAPIVYVASKMNIPTIIHEQNAIPGLTNIFLSRYASTIAISFPESKKMFPKAKNIIITGNPRASAVVTADKEKGLAFLNFDSSLPLVVVLGGSRGAKVINDAMNDWLSNKEQLPFRIVFVTGSVNYNRFKEKASENIRIYPFIYNMPEVLACADLVIGRAGATFLAEITSLGIPSILIPSPYVTNNHQVHNAMALKDKGAAMVIPENEVSGKKLKQAVLRLIQNSFVLEEYKNAAKKLGKRDAANIFRLEIEKLISKDK